MKRTFAFTSAALVLGVSISLVAGSIVINTQKVLASRTEWFTINNQKTWAYRIDDPTPRAYSGDSSRTYAGEARINASA